MDDLNGYIDPFKLKLKVTCFRYSKEITLIMEEILYSIYQRIYISMIVFLRKHCCVHFLACLV